MLVRGRNITPTSVHNRILRALGRRGVPVEDQWVRCVMNRSVGEEIDALGPEMLDAVEISGRQHEARPWKSYSTLDFPDFDICHPPDELPQFDIVLCEQVIEHLPDPWRAVKTLHDLARPGGHVIATTPFLYKVHPAPRDYWRFTPEGMALLLESAGLRVLTVGSWGNRSATIASLRWDLAARRWRSLKNDPILPVVVWGIAQRPEEAGGVQDVQGPVAAAGSAPGNSAIQRPASS